jgi:glutaredoxin 3
MNIIIYTKANCPNCVAAKQLLKSKGLDYFECSVDLESNRLDLLTRYPEAKQLPQIIIDKQRVGGLAGLQAAFKQLGI